MTRIFLPELDAAFETTQNNPHHCYTVGEHLMHCMLYTESDKSMRIAALLHDIGKPVTRTTDEQGIDHFHGHAGVGEEMAARILRRLKFDNDTITHVRKLVKYHDYPIETTPRAVRRAINTIGETYFSGEGGSSGAGRSFISADTGTESVCFPKESRIDRK